MYCYYCRKDGHYSNQCPVKANDKQPAVNMVIVDVTDVQQVTVMDEQFEYKKMGKLMG